MPAPTPGRTHVLHVLSRLERGGAEMRTLELIKGLRSAAFRFTVVASSGRAGSLDQEFTAAGAHVVHLPLDVRFPARFIQLLRREHVDVVHSHIHLTSGPILLLAALAGVRRRMVFFHSPYDGRGAGVVRRVVQWTKRLMLRWCATDILGVSAATLDAVWGLGWRNRPRCRVIYLGVEATECSPGRDRRALRRRLLGLDVGTMVVHVGRMHPSKNHPRVVSVFREFHRQRPDSVLCLVGRDDPVVRAQIDRLLPGGVESGGIVFLGERADVRDLFCSADAFLFPSLWEGLPGALLESIATGLPAVASSIPANREAAEVLEGIQLVSLEEEDEEWGAALERACSVSDDERARIAGSFLRSRYTFTASEQAHADLWRSV